MWFFFHSDWKQYHSVLYWLLQSFIQTFLIWVTNTGLARCFYSYVWKHTLWIQMFCKLMKHNLSWPFHPFRFWSKHFDWILWIPMPFMDLLFPFCITWGRNSFAHGKMKASLFTVTEKQKQKCSVYCWVSPAPAWHLKVNWWLYGHKSRTLSDLNGVIKAPL